jgi:choline-sulfatase
MASADPPRPNFLVIVSDDQGPWALGCAGSQPGRIGVGAA